MSEPGQLTSDHPEVLAKSIVVLKRGALIALPTDTVYGLAADPWNGQAVSKLYEAKRRSELKSIPVLVYDATDIAVVAQAPSERLSAVAEEFWPGPLTLVVKRKDELPSEISATPTVGVRAPDQEFALRLLREFGPLATTSANLTGHPSSRNAPQVVASLGEAVDLVVDGGETVGGIPSTVIDLTVDPPMLLRDGPVSLEAVLEVWRRY